MDNSLHYLLLATQGLFQRKVMHALSGTGLTAGQPKILDYLGLHDGSMQKNIATACQIDPATLTGLLNRMEEKGLIERRCVPGDRRSFHVYLTEAGWACQKQVRETLERLETELLSALDGPEQTQLLNLLERLCEHMIDLEALQ